MEWIELPRSFRALDGEREFDVWKVGGEGWRLTIKSQDGEYIASEGGFRDVESAQGAAEKYRQNPALVP